MKNNINELSFKKEAYIHYDYFINVARKFTQNRMDAEDLVQDTFTRAYRHYNSFKDGTNCKAWLYTIMKNIFFSYCRKNKNITEIYVSEFHDLAVNTHSESALTREEMISQMGKIREEFRRVLVLFHLEELSLKEISTLLNWPLGTVKSRLFRGRNEFRDLLTKNKIIA